MISSSLSVPIILFNRLPTQSSAKEMEGRA